MKPKKQILIPHIILLFVVFTSTAQNPAPFPSKYTSTLTKWYEENPQEKVVLQTDKGYYLAGETIWMKAWCTLENKPTYLSKIIYVDLVNERGDVVVKNMYRLDSLSSIPAAIDLSYSLNTGNYTIRAYTLWMLNYEFIAKKNIFIYNSNFRSANPMLIKPELYVQFFPEGGSLVDGIEAKVAFKIVDQNGMPVAAKGYLTDGSGKTIVSFETIHDGMGYFLFKPSAGEIYFGNINNYSNQFKLPEIRKEGVSISVDNKPSKIFVSLERSSGNSSSYNSLYLSAVMNGQIAFFGDIDFDEGKNAAAISKKNLPPGIMQLTIFTKLGIPIAERIVFIENYTVQKPTLQLEKNTVSGDTLLYTFKIDSLTTGSNTLVVSDRSLTSGIYTEENFASSLFLSSDIKGYIHNSGYYFEDKSAARMKHLDLLLMTQGWRRYNWQDLFENKQPKLKFPVESNITIKGVVTKSDRDAVVTDGRVNFVIKGDDSTKILSEARLTDKGEFIVNDLQFGKKAFVYYQGTNAKKEKYIVDVKFYPSYIDSLTKTLIYKEANLDTININSYTAMADFLRKQFDKIDTLGFKYKNLSEIVIKGKKPISPQDSLNLTYASPGVFQTGMSLDPSHTNYQNIWMYLRTQVPGLIVNGDINSPLVSFNRYLGSELQPQSLNEAGQLQAPAGNSPDLINGVQVNSGGIAFYLNETNVPQEVIETLLIDDIALVKILRLEAAALGLPNGAIAIYTKKGVNPYKKIYDKTFSYKEITGYSPIRQFYEQPVSPNINITKSATILWNGAFSNKQNKFSIKFLKETKPRAIKICLRGIDKSGNISSIEQIVELND